MGVVICFFPVIAREIFGDGERGIFVDKVRVI